MFVVLFYNCIYSVFNMKPFGWLVLLYDCHLFILTYPDNSFGHIAQP